MPLRHHPASIERANERNVLETVRVGDDDAPRRHLTAMFRPHVSIFRGATATWASKPRSTTKYPGLGDWTSLAGSRTQPAGGRLVHLQLRLAEMEALEVVD